MEEIFRTMAHEPKLVFFICWSFFLVLGIFIFSISWDGFKIRAAFVWILIWILVGIFWSTLVCLATGFRPF